MPLDALALNVLLAATGIAVGHTLLGPDHYLPFIMLARARRWSFARTMTITSLCGIAHVGSSVLLGTVGLLLGFALGHVSAFEGQRGPIAAWLLIGFGVAYALWGIRHALRQRGGFELHDHGPSIHLHAHGTEPHQHAAPNFAAGFEKAPARSTVRPAHHGHTHLFGGHHHAHTIDARQTTFWTLFAVFVLGPCEPLIPLFMLPASRGRWGLAGATALVFGIATVVCMLGATALGYAGLSQLRATSLERWSHAMAGGVIAASGMAVVFLGL